MKVGKHENIDDFFIKNKAIKLKLIKEAIENPNKKLPPAREIAANNNASELTIKKVEKELAQSGYINSNKKGGTKIANRYTQEQVSSYVSFKESFKDIANTLVKIGFSKEDILALAYDVISEIIDKSISNIIYTENDDEIAVFAKKELEKKLGFEVTFKPLETLKAELKNRILKDKIIIVPFFCYEQIGKLNYASIKIIPIKTKHPLEEFSYTYNLPFASKIFYIAASKLDKENSNLTYKGTLKDRYKVYIYTKDEISSNNHILNHADIVIGYWWLIENSKHILKSAKKVIKKNRFDDNEGIKMIIYYLNKLEGN